MQFEIFAYWSTSELVTLFNAIAALTNSSDFLSLLRLLGIIGILSVALVVLGGGLRMDHTWRWVMMAALFHGMLLIPKATVVIIDRTSSGAPPYVVANVPVGIASVISTTTKIGDFLTTAFETVFSLPNEVQFRKSGTLFGARVVRNLLMARSGSPVLSANMTDFIRECVYPELATGYIHSQDLVREQDLWNFLNGRTNIARYVEIRQIPSGTMMLPMTCPDAYTTLTTQINTVVNTAINDLSNVLNPTVPVAMRQALTQNQIVTAANLYTGISSSAPEIMRQGIIMNQFLDAQYNIPAQVGNTASAASSLAVVQSIRSTSESYRVMATAGQQVMPKVRNVIEMVLYALAPLTLFMIIIMGHFGFSALGMYIKCLLWIQLWPPLYAVLNFIMTMYSSKEALAVANGGMSMHTIGYLNNMMVSDQAIAGMIAVVGVPTISWMLVNGMALGASAFASAIGSPAGAEAARFAAAASQGNINMGQAGIDNQTMYQHQEQPNYHQGAPVLYGTAANGIQSTTFANGEQAFSSALIRHNTSMRMTFGERMSNTFQQQAESSLTVSAGEMITSAQNYAAGLQQSFDFVRSHGDSERLGTQTGTTSQIGFNESVSRAEQITNDFARNHNLSQKQGAEIIGYASALIKNPKAIEKLLPIAIEASAKVAGSSTAQADQTLKSAISYLQKDGYADALNHVEQAARNTSFDSADESARRAMAGINSSFTESRTHADTSSAQFQQSEAYRELAGQLKESSGAFEGSMFAPFMRWMGSQYNSYLGRNFDGATVMEMAEKNPELLIPFLDSFYKQHMEPIVNANAPHLNSPEDIRRFFSEQSQMLGGATSVRNFHAGARTTVSGMAGSTGVSPSDTVGSNLPDQFNVVRGRVRQAMDAGAGYVSQQGAPVMNQANRMTEPGSQPLTGIAGSNALAGALPDSLGAKTLNNLPGIDIPLAVPGAAIPEAQKIRMEQGNPQDPKLETLRKLTDTNGKD